MEIFNSTSGTWGSVCDDYWGFEEAVVVCHMLGFRTAIRSFSRLEMSRSHSQNVCFSPRNLELYSNNRDVIMYSYHYATAHFLTNNGVLLIVRSPAPSSALQRVGTSDICVSRQYR